MANEEAGSTPRVCVCGYDLAGLPPSPAAKCPECGAVVAELRPRVPLLKRTKFLLVLAFMPSAIAITTALLVLALPRSPASRTLETVGFVLAAMWFLGGTIAATTSLVVDRAAALPPGRRSLARWAAVGACIVGQIWLMLRLASL